MFATSENQSPSKSAGKKFLKSGTEFLELTADAVVSWKQIKIWSAEPDDSPFIRLQFHGIVGSPGGDEKPLFWAKLPPTSDGDGKSSVLANDLARAIREHFRMGVVILFHDGEGDLMMDSAVLSTDRIKPLTIGFARFHGEFMGSLSAQDSVTFFNDVEVPP